MLMLWKFVIINSVVRFNNLSMINTLQKCESVPKVSVIIPVYNVEKYIKRCIESVLSQTLQDFEIIIVNDYTPDKSMDVIEDYIKNDSRIVSVNNYSNMGLMWTRREGYKIAKGEYFYFLDSDDFIPCDALEKVYNKAVEEDADIVFGNFQYVDNDGTKGKIHKHIFPYGAQKEGIYKAMLSFQLLHCVWSKLYSRRLFDNYKYDTFPHQTNAEDCILTYQLIKNVNKISQIDDAVYYYFDDPTSSSKKRFTNDVVRQYAFSLAYVYNLLKAELVFRAALNRFMAFHISALCYNNYDIEIIKSNIGENTAEVIMGLSSLCKYNRIGKAILYWILWRSNLFRVLIYKLRPVINYIRH